MTSASRRLLAPPMYFLQKQPLLLKNLLHSLGLVLQIYEGHDDQLNRPGPMA
jgi:hypothetical protein